MSAIHPSAVIEPGAEIGADVTIGPFSVIGSNVCLGDGVEIHPHVVVGGRTSLGAGVKVFPHATVGMVPQDLKYHGEPSRLEVGANTVIRENATLHLGTEGGGLLTKVGSNCLIMANAHVAHDCMVGNNVILVNCATLGGHVHVGDNTIVGGLAAVHQWVRIGEGAMVGGMTGVENDIIPYGMVTGNRARLGGLNLVGLRRANLPREDIHALRNAYKALFDGDDPLQARVDRVAAEFGGSPLVDRMLEFIRAGGDRAICTPRLRDRETE
ncbi:acyl-ACP--UDP-N-acetylglucosamine O-acyltransferase [Oryzibacter oryziterrae]|uniref:acyl-ACP--UDP-N-acetylglucosamine O-acyltransferase n=1 Tax=Oryzibacter oryziterrae TaxID=2766474 RepID=UPI001F019936|nr:acyl-ACP--UDP-N-acetylglucosamine O-acyltransferase [Oryzibacter oryziterrae]